MAALSPVRTSLARSFNLMRCMLLGSSHVRLCHNGAKDSDNSSSENEDKIEDTATTEGEEFDDYTSDEGEEGIDDESISERILTAALEFVPQYGWSAQAIAEGAKVEGFSGMTEGMFPREGGDLALHFIDQCNLNLGDYLTDNSRTQEENRKKIGQTNFIKDAVEVRLRMIIPYIESWPQVMGLMLYPSNAADALQSVANMTDDIWYHSNDSSTDVSMFQLMMMSQINWYLKRTSLATIYGLTELYMIRDKSEDFQNTWTFLDRRFQDIRNTGNIKNSCNKVGEDMSKLACSTVTLIRNITGFNKWGR